MCLDLFRIQTGGRGPVFFFLFQPTQQMNNKSQQHIQLSTYREVDQFYSSKSQGVEEGKVMLISFYKWTEKFVQDCKNF